MEGCSDDGALPGVEEIDQESRDHPDDEPEPRIHRKGGHLNQADEDPHYGNEGKEGAF